MGHGHLGACPPLWLFDRTTMEREEEVEEEGGRGKGGGAGGTRVGRNGVRMDRGQMVDGGGAGRWRMRGRERVWMPGGKEGLQDLRASRLCNACPNAAFVHDG